MEELLRIKDLYVDYYTLDGAVHAINGLNLVLHKGEALGLVGETGAGKTTAALATLGLLPKRNSKVLKGSIEYDGTDLLSSKNSAYLRSIQGNKISMVFQNPLTSLNPVFKIGEQIAMVYRRHKKMSKREALGAAKSALEMVGIPDYRVDDYPVQFSGGMRQRVGLAAAMACDPDLLIADEPTTALDVTIQAQVLELMRELKQQRNMSLIMITHNLGIVNELCQRVAVMYGGRIIEYGHVREVFQNPKHPYTVGLLGSLPDVNIKTERLSPIPGFVINPMKLPKGCKFAERCPNAQDRCREDEPQEQKVSGEHTVCCFNFDKNEVNTNA